MPELVPIRHGRMAASPFAFYRGAANVLASDLAASRAPRCTCSSAATRTWSNFGGFASPERNLVFDVNDFDETLPGPFDWDVKRLGGEHGDRRPRPRASAASGAARSCATPVRSYREAMRDLRRHAEPRPLVLPPRRGRPLRRWGQDVGKTGPPKAFQKTVEQGRVEGPAEGRVQADRAGRRRAALPQRPTAARPRRGALRRRRPRQIEDADPGRSCAPTGTRSSPTGATCSRATGSCSWPGRSSAWAASAPAAGWCCWSASTTTTRCSSR